MDNTFDLKEWVGRGEKNLLNEETKALDFVNKLKDVGKNVRSNPEAKAFFDNVFSDAGIDTTSKDSITRMLKAVVTRTADKKLLDAFEKNLNKGVQEGSKNKPTFFDALFDDNAWLLRFLSSSLAGIGAIGKVIFKLYTGDPTVIEDILYALAFVFMSLSMVFGGTDNPDPSGKGGLRVIHKRKRK